MLYRKWGSKEDAVIKYTSSVDSDHAILEQVKEVMEAHVVELYLDGVISKKTARDILFAVKEFKEIKQGYEDVHEALEDHILTKVGEEGGWVGMGRSRNDHVATALRLKMREEILEILEGLLELRKVVLNKAMEHKITLFPSFTHLQPAQPTTFAHYLMYVEEEISSRWGVIFSVLKTLNRSPLGSGAIVGTNVKLNRKREAEMLGFDGVIVNTISATSSRADMISAIAELTTLMVSLSRVAEDLIFLSSSFVGYLRLPDSQVSTSSLMPQKRNAVTMEVLRAKGGECVGTLTSIMAMYKGLPSGYDLDLQEMNAYYWKCTSIVKATIEVLKDLFQGIQVVKKDLDSSTLATDEAERLALNGKPYRQAYFEVKEMVLSDKFTSKITPEESVKLKAVTGSPNPQILEEDLKDAIARLERDSKSLDDYENLILSKIGQLRVVEDDVMQEGL
ncbi:MAG: argininosuccinate lyase [Candidatus Aramenus sp.]|jgi:argininosuccinate lyase|nr:argininosuccinate lyase [Candidatus Aramenus sp.]